MPEKHKVTVRFCVFLLGFVAQRRAALYYSWERWKFDSSRIHREIFSHKNLKLIQQILLGTNC